MADSDTKAPNSHASQTLIDGNVLAAKALARFGADRMFGVVASAYGYLTGRPGVLLTVSGPGCVHGLADRSRETLLQIVCKAKDIRDIPDCVFRVIDRAISGRPGACYLDLPSDVLHQTIQESDAESLLDAVAESSEKREAVFRVSNSDTEKAVSLLRNAERPLIVCGKGAALLELRTR
ncbi:hypothetical protein FNV43_RR13144 [Rhamnella rubrinervis]|uniref:Thiamine pyrophosphate enzyme N-terminal TPP-binding domain-containing protein n=1 Tax=Rhamnella rubrinervis TaxID=2594499 RepID=A0A8K0H0I5_9ROSA|nr:hypothetical protein FNV43_RR13144 [Rhamnella rubrinervis]